MQMIQHCSSDPSKIYRRPWLHWSKYLTDFVWSLMGDNIETTIFVPIKQEYPYLLLSIIDKLIKNVEQFRFLGSNKKFNKFNTRDHEMLTWTESAKCKFARIMLQQFCQKSNSTWNSNVQRKPRVQKGTRLCSYKTSPLNEEDSVEWRREEFHKFWIQNL